MVRVTRDIQIRDIRSGTDVDLKKNILAGIQSPQRTLPTLLLYDETGLKLFERITYLEEYYLTNTEISILESKSDEIVKRLGLESGGVVVELGSGYTSALWAD
jgi:L-histidine Nalpha-methyltransferase / hercynylcysteine S-oxide synthase